MALGGSEMRLLSAEIGKGAGAYPAIEHLAKVRVAGSSPVARSSKRPGQTVLPSGITFILPVGKLDLAHIWSKSLFRKVLGLLRNPLIPFLDVDHD
jgi:hypothetical protein